TWRHRRQARGYCFKSTTPVAVSPTKWSARFLVASSKWIVPRRDAQAELGWGWRSVRVLSKSWEARSGLNEILNPEVHSGLHCRWHIRIADVPLGLGAIYLPPAV